MKIYIFFFIFLFNLSKQDLNDDKKKQFNDFFSVVLRKSGVDDEKINKCIQHDSSFFEKFVDEFEFTGKKYGDFGDEDSCIQSNLLYFLYILDIKNELNNELINKNYNENNRRIKVFLDISKFPVGMCISKECVDAIMYLIIKNSNYFNEVFNDVIFGDTKIMLKEKFRKENIFYDIYNSSLLESRLEYKYSNYYYEIKIFIYVYIFLMVLFTLLKMIFFFSNNDEIIDDIKKNKFDDELNIQNDNSSDIEDFSSIFNKKDDDQFLIQQDLINNSFFRFFSIFDILINLKSFISLNNLYYNGNNIEFIGFIRMIVIIGMIFGKNFIIATNIFVQINVFNFQIYKTLLFSLIKLTDFDDIIWIILDGCIFGFKLLSCIKTFEQKNKNTKEIIFSKFLLYLIPKIFIFFFIYFFGYIFFSNSTNDITGLEYYLTFIKDLKCYKNPSFIFNPFNYYKNDVDEECFFFTYIFINEFYGIILLLIIFFISFKFKSKIFDSIFSVLMIINLFSVQLTNSSFIPQNNPITIKLFEGQKYTEKQFHLFISFFFLGFLLGNIFFHFHDSVSQYSLSDHIDYIPFSFTRKMMIRINKIKTLLNIIIIIICSIILLLISSIPYFFKDYYGNGVKDLGEDQYNTLIEIIQIIGFYEKSIFAIFFSILLVCLKILCENTFLTSLIHLTFFITFEKIRVSFLCSIEIMMIYCYSVFHFNYLISYNNLMFITFGLFLILYGFNSMMYVIFELTFIKFVKAITNGIKDKNYPLILVQ